MDKALLTKQHNEAVERVHTAAEAIRSAGDDADYTKLDADLKAAEAEAERTEGNLKRAEDIDKIDVRFVKRDMPKDNPNHLGMDDKEVRSYSLLRAINAQVSGDWRGAELEREASEEIAKRMGRDPNGFYVPLEVQSEKRDLVVGTPTAGGNLVAPDFQAASMIDLLRNQMVLTQAGAQFLSGLVGDVKIPRQSGGATFYWVAENAAPTESQQTVDQVTLSPKTGGAWTDISRKLLKQSSVDVENLVRGDLAKVCALGIDLAGFHGAGTGGAPLGIAGTLGVGGVAGGTNGAAPTYDNIVDLESEVAIDNADIGALGYITNTKVRGKLKKTLITPTYGEGHVWEKGATPLNGYAAYVTNQVASNLTKGTSTGICSAIFFGNWADCIIGQWGTLDVMVDPYTGGTAGTVRIIALQDVDIAVRHPESFAVMLDALA